MLILWDVSYDSRYVNYHKLLLWHTIMAYQQMVVWHSSNLFNYNIIIRADRNQCESISRVKGQSLQISLSRFSTGLLEVHFNPAEPHIANIFVFSFLVFEKKTLHARSWFLFVRGRAQFLNMWRLNFLVIGVCHVSRTNALKSWILKKSHVWVLSTTIKRTYLPRAGITRKQA